MTTKWLTRKETPRERAEHQVMTDLNKRKAFWEHYLDCGKLGVLHISWSGTHWICHWIEIVPFAVEEEHK